jgi:diaminopimelate epimerase
MMRVLIAAELGLAVVALVWARFSSTTISYAIDARVLLASLGLTIPFAALNFSVFQLGRRYGMAKKVYALFENELFPLIQRAYAWELLVASALAGFAEELLFRGLLQPWIGLLPASLLFGLAHGPTFELIAFSAWATLAGLLFGTLYEVTGNLAHPVLVHAFYDAFALLYVKYAWSPPERERVDEEREGTEELESEKRGQSLELEYAKAEALGNDFLLVREADAGRVRASDAELARAICDRHRGLGADGLILFDAPASSPSVRMRLLNSDGSRAEVSGNGLRCLAALLVHRRLVTTFPLHIETDAGRRSLERLSSSDPDSQGGVLRFRADMGSPDAFEEVSLDVGGAAIDGTSLSVGNPHFVVLGDGAEPNVDELRRIGPLIAGHERFPNGTNVELVHVVERNRIRVAFWERGAGETSSSGTGSSAAAAAVLRKGLVDSPVIVECLGGASTVEWSMSPGASLYLSGEAVVVTEGRYFYRTDPGASPRSS